jgi:hypothetical protein
MCGKTGSKIRTSRVKLQMFQHRRDVVCGSKLLPEVNTMTNRFFFAIALVFFAAGCNAGAASNPLLGTWTAADSSCATPIVFTAQNETITMPYLGGPERHPKPITFPAKYNIVDAHTVITTDLSGSAGNTWTVADPTHMTNATNNCEYTKK